MRGRICFRPAALWPIEIHKEFRKSDYINSSENTHQIGRAAAVNSCSVPMNAIWDLLNHAIKRVDPLKLSELIKSQAATTKHHHFRRMVPMILRNRTWNSGENSIDWNFRLNSWFCRFLTLAAESQPVKQSKYQFSTSSCQRKHKITCCYNTFSLVVLNFVAVVAQMIHNWLFPKSPKKLKSMFVHAAYICRQIQILKSMFVHAAYICSNVYTVHGHSRPGRRGALTGPWTVDTASCVQ